MLEHGIIRFLKSPIQERKTFQWIHITLKNKSRSPHNGLEGTRLSPFSSQYLLNFISFHSLPGSLCCSLTGLISVHWTYHKSFLFHVYLYSMSLHLLLPFAQRSVTWGCLVLSLYLKLQSPPFGSICFHNICLYYLFTIIYSP